MTNLVDLWLKYDFTHAVLMAHALYCVELAEMDRACKCLSDQGRCSKIQLMWHSPH